MKKFVLLVLLACVLAQPLAHADNVWDMAESDQYGRKVFGMLGRGLVNIATSFIDVIVQTVDGTKQGPPFIGTATGLGRGIGCTSLRLLSGALDVTTFWVPSFNGYAVCRSYVDCVNCALSAAPVAAAPAPAAPQPAIIQVQQPAPAPAEESPMKYVKK